MADHGGDHPITTMGIINELYPIGEENYIKLVSDIGRGVGSTVHKAACDTIPIDSSLVAIKVIDLQKSNPDFEDEAYRKMKGLKAFPDHPNILKPYCIFTVKSSSLWVVMPFISGGSLQSVVASYYPDGLPEEFIAAVLKQILTALNHLQDHGLTHRDIKAGNILIDSVTGEVKLADFCFSADARLGTSFISWALASISSSSSSSSEVISESSPYWMVPEGAKRGLHSDIWSLGITALELAHGRAPLSATTKSFSDSFKSFVGFCLDRDPMKRPSARMMLQHMFFQKYCKGPDFLVENMQQQGVAAVDQRSDDSENHVDRLKRDDECDSSVIGWKYNSEGFYLEAMFSPDDGISGDAAALNRLMMMSFRYMKRSADEHKQKAAQINEAIKRGDVSLLTQEMEEMAIQLKEFFDKWQAEAAKKK